MNEGFFKEAVQPLKELISRNNIDVASLTAVELIGGQLACHIRLEMAVGAGGGTRVPRVQVVLSEALEGRSLDK